MNKVTNVYEDKKSIPFNNFWFICKIEEDGLREICVQTFARRKQKFGNFSPQKGKKNIAKIQCYVNYQKDYPKLKKGNNKKDKEEAHFTKEVEEVEKNKS